MDSGRDARVPAGEDARATTEPLCIMTHSGQNRSGSGFHSRGVLPHLERPGGSYFVCFRLAGTLPKEVLARFKQERERIVNEARFAKRPLTWREQEELFRWYSKRVDSYLDTGHGRCF